MPRMRNPLAALIKITAGACAGHRIGLTWKGRMILFDHDIEQAKAEAALEELLSDSRGMPQYGGLFGDVGSSSDVIVYNSPTEPDCICGFILTDRRALTASERSRHRLIGAVVRDQIRRQFGCTTPLAIRDKAREIAVDTLTEALVRRGGRGSVKKAASLVLGGRIDAFARAVLLGWAEQVSVGEWELLRKSRSGRWIRPDS